MTDKGKTKHLSMTIPVDASGRHQVVVFITHAPRCINHKEVTAFSDAFILTPGHPH